MPNTLVSFPSSNGETITASLFFSQNNTPHSSAILLHDYMDDHHVGVKSVQSELVKQGFSVLSIALPHHPINNKLKTSHTNLLLSAVNYLEMTGHNKPRLLLGHGMGGAIALHSKCYLPWVQGIITLDATSGLGFYSMHLRKLKNLQCPLLILHNKKAAAAAPQEAIDIYHAANEPKFLSWLNHSEHHLSGQNNHMHMLISHWVQHHILPQIDTLPDLPTTNEVDKKKDY